MRGQTHRQQWAIVYQSGTQKRWREYAYGRAAVMICGFVAFIDYNKRKNWNARSGALPVRLLAPGGIIAGEHNIKPRTDKRTKNNRTPKDPAVRELVSTSNLAPSITAAKPDGYPFLTYPVKSRRSRTLQG